MSYSKIFCIIIVFVFAFSNLSARKANENYSGPNPEAIAGAQALVFQYTPFQSTLKGVPVGTAVGQIAGEIISLPILGMGYKIFISDNFSLGTALYFGSESSSQDAGQDANGNDRTRDMNQSSFGLSVDANYQMKPLYSVAPYIGGNINMGSYSTTDETTPGTTTKTEYSSFTFGIGAHIGFDWYFTEGLSLGGRYGFGYLSYGTPESKTTQGETTNKTEFPTQSYFGLNMISVILNVHF